MIYDFECYEDEDGCGSQFEITCSMSEISQLKPKCPVCHKEKPVHRFWGNVYCFGPNKTLGSLADKNSKGMSSDQKHYLNQKNNAYRYKEFQGALPEGAKKFERDSDGKRKE